MQIIKKTKDKIREHIKRRSDAKIARVEGYAQGTEDASKELMRQVRALNTRIGELTQENLLIEERLRNHYNERTDILESRHTEKCKKCMLITEAERERLRKNQNMILDLIQKFNIVFMKVFKHANLVVDEHDNIIKSSGRVKASRDILLGIKSEADKIIQKVLPLTSTNITEDSQYDTQPSIPHTKDKEQDKEKTKQH